MINIDRQDLYQHSKPELKERTKKRLIQISDIGMTETSVASFGIEGVMSGLYIERVWSYTDEEWSNYIAWVNGLMVNQPKNNGKS